MKFNFEDTGTTTVDSVAGVTLGLTNGAGVATDFHGAIGTGVAGIGKALDFTSATAGNGNNPLAATANNSTVNFGTVNTFTVTMWIKPTGAMNFARWFCLAANGVVDNGAVNSLGFQANNNFTSSQTTVNAVNTAVNGISIPLNQWTFIAYTYDGVNVTVYTASETGAVGAGVVVANAGGPVNIGSAFSMWIGNRLSNRQRGFPAYFDDVRFYNGSGDSTFVENVRKEAIPDPFVLATTVVPNTAVVGTAVSISATVGGTQPISYTWQQVNGGVTNLIPSAGPTLNIPSVALSDAGTYSLIVSNNPGGVPTVRTNIGATLTVRSAANPLVWRGTNNFNWDTSSLNWSNSSTLADGVAYIAADSVTFDDNGRGSTAISVTSATLYPSSVSVSSVFTNYTFAGSGLGGPMNLTKNGSSTLALNNPNTFTGNVTVNGGVLRTGNGSALGTTNGNTTVSGGSLDVGGQNLGLEEIAIQGTGAGGTNGTIFNSGGQQQSAISRVVMTGPALINSGANRWDVHGAGGQGYFRGNSNTLSKIGAQDIWLKDVSDTGLGQVQILQGVLGFQGVIGMGDPSATITVSNASLGFWATLPPSPLTKNVVLTNSTLSSGGGPNDFHGPITLQGTNTLAVNTDLHLFAALSGASAGVTKNGTAILTLDGNNTYTGSTLINGGSIVLGAGSTLSASSVIRLSPNTSLDASATPSGLTRSSGQSLLGLGNNALTATVSANVTNTSGSTLAPGVAGPGVLTINGSLSLSGTTIPINLGNDPGQVGNGVNDVISVASDLVLSGINSIQITPVAPLTAGNYTILTYGGTLNGGLANLTVSSANPRYTFSVVNPATTPGSIQISVVGNPIPLVWKGGNPPGPNIWNHSFTNWLNTGTGLFDNFYNGDLVSFDDTGTTNLVNVTETNVVGAMLLTNSSLSYTFVGAGNLAGLLGKEGSGLVTFALSNSLTLSAITNNNGTLAFNPPVNQTLAAPIQDNGSALSTVLKTGTNMLTLTGDSSLYSGAIAVTNGVLRYNNASALGAAAFTYSTNGGTVDINNVDTGARNIAIQGAGFNGQGALANLTTTWPPFPYQIVHNVTMIGDAAIGANGRWDVASGTFNGNGFKLTKVLPSQIVLNNIGETSVGEVDILAGELTFQQSATMGDPTKVVTVRSNAVLGLWAGTEPWNKANITVINATITSGGSTNALAGPVTLQPGTNIIFTSVDLSFLGPVSGVGGFIKQGGGTLWFYGANTYGGPTIIGQNSTVLVEAASSLGSSSLIEIDGGSTLNVAAPASFSLGAGQTLIGNGTLRGGNIIFGSGSTLSVGFSGSTYTLTAIGNLTFQADSTNFVDVNKTVAVANDRVIGLTSVTIGGRLVINNIGNPLAGGDALQLFGSTNYAGTFASITPATPGPGLLWDTSTLTTDGTLRVFNPAVNTTPTNIIASVSGNQLTLSWPADRTGWTLQTNSVNVADTNAWFEFPPGTGSRNTNQVTLTINPSMAHVFYRLRYP